MRRIVTILALACFLAAGSHGALAQQTGEILGRVADASGAVVPGVTVTLTGGSLITPLVAVTSSTGAYRFPRLPIGIYSVKFELGGFKTVVREEIRLEIGFNAQIDATMEVSNLQETVIVRGENPIVDLRDTSRSNRFTLEALQSIPSARDPWVIIEQSAGIAMDRQNVGGSASGRQSNFVARGANMAEQKWNLDGVDITDMAATGGSPIYFDFDAFEEMQITAGGADVSMQTPGVAVNLVTKSGTDKLRGSGRYYVTSDRFESQNVTDAIRRQGVSTGNPIQSIDDYGFEVGGPVKKGRAWFWGSYGKQDIKVGVNGFYKASAGCQAMKADPMAYSLEDIRACLNSDTTLLNNYNAKLAVQPFKNNLLSFYFNAAEKVRNARNASDTHPIETTWRQGSVPSDAGFGSSFWKTGMPKTYKWGDRHIFTDRFMVEAQYAHVGNNFTLDFHDPSLYDVQPVYDYSGFYYRSFLGVYYVRPTDSVEVTGNYFAPGWLGGDHSLKVGFRWRDDEAISKEHDGGYTWAITEGGTASAWGTPVEAWLVRDTLTDEARHYRSFYFQDSYNRKNMTVNAGFRFDYQTDEQLPSSVPAHPFYGQPTIDGTIFDQLPAIDFKGRKAGLSFRNWSPRVGVTYDLTGSARHVLKVNYGRYVGQIGGNTTTLSGIFNPADCTEIDYPWTDLNGDSIVQANEIDISTPLWWTNGYDPDNPASLTTSGSNGAGVSNTFTDEIIVGVDHHLPAGIAVTGSFIYRRYNNLAWTDGEVAGSYSPFGSAPEGAPSGITAADYRQSTYTPSTASCPQSGARCQPVTFWAPVNPLPSDYVRQNRPGYYRDYKGFELAVRKRMSNRWMMNASFSYNDARARYTSESYVDPTNIDMANGAQFAEESTSSGLDNVFVNAKWIFRASGAYAMPVWDINVAGFYNARSGYPFMPVIYVPASQRNTAGAVNVLLDPVGELRLPTFHQLDFRLDKSIRFGPARFTLSMDVFNMFNANTTLAIRRQQNATNANRIANVVAPRVIRFGVRMTF